MHKVISGKKNIKKSFKYYATLFYGFRIKMHNEPSISGRYKCSQL